jgi:hypothetical protein
MFNFSKRSLLCLPLTNGISLGVDRVSGSFHVGCTFWQEISGICCGLSQVDIVARRWILTGVRCRMVILECELKKLSPRCQS